VLRIVVLISGRGSNMEALIRARDGGRLQVEIAAVISNHAAAGGLAVAAAHGIATTIVPHREFPDRASFDAALAGAIDAFEPGLVVLAGFMRILTPDFVDRYAGRLMNIHPSLLPAFPGLDTHERALASGCKIHGATVHFVTPELDHGPIIAQAAVPILPNDDAEVLARRVLALEHIIYPQAVGWFARGELSVESGVVRVTDPAARQLVMT
jgi:phosphoribosylglycinamide formyltransferase-1